MATEHGRGLAALALGLLVLGAPVHAQIRDRSSERVCVPATDGRSWECGTRANPPPPRGLPPVPARTSAPPPPFLAAPPLGFGRAPAEPVAAESVAAESVAAESVAAESVAAESAAAEPAAAEPAADDAPARIVPKPTVAAAARGAAEFLELPAQAYTVQVARATDPSRLLPLAALTPCHRIAIEAAGAREYLLLCGVYADAGAARAAALSAGLAAWPRRIGPLQNEIRRLE